MADLWGPEARERARMENAERKRVAMQSFFGQRAGKVRRQKVIDLEGQTIGRLTVLRRGPSIIRARWRCQCSCGAELTVDSSTLLRAQRKGSDYACETCKPRANRE